MRRKKLPSPEQILNAVRSLGIARLVSGGEVPLGASGLGFVATLSLEEDILGCDPAEALGLLRRRSAKVLESLREAGVPYERYACQFMCGSGSSSFRVYGCNFSSDFSMINEISHFAAMSEAIERTPRQLSAPESQEDVGVCRGGPAPSRLGIDPE